MWVNKVGFGNKHDVKFTVTCGYFVVMSLPAASVTWGSSTSPRKVWWRCWAGGWGRRGRGRKELTTTWQVTCSPALTHMLHHHTADVCMSVGVRLRLPAAASCSHVLSFILWFVLSVNVFVSVCFDWRVSGPDRRGSGPSPLLECFLCFHKVFGLWPTEHVKCYMLNVQTHVKCKCKC